MQISSSLLVNVGVRQSNADKYIDALNEQLPKYQIDTRLRVAHFLSQVLHESAKMRAVSENLNYSASGLRRVFRKYFPTDALAREYARQPQRIANRVYANRLGNGSEASGDGYRYRGRGLIQLTGKSNYREFARWLGVDVVADPDRVASEFAVHSAVFFWNTRGLNALADNDDVRAVTRRINGGLNGLPDRENLLSKLKQQLQSMPDEGQGGGSTDDQETERKTPTHTVTATSLNLRSQPAVRSDTLIASLSRGTPVAKLQEAADSSWWKIQATVNGGLREGYVAAQYLQALKLEPDHTVSVLLLNLRSRPVVAADTLITRMPQGTAVAKLEVLASDPGWWKIQVELNAQLLEGYVAARYLRALQKPPTHTVTASSLNLRSEPVVRADTQIARLARGTPVARLEVAQDPSWWKIQLELDGKLVEGYVAARYLDEIAG